MTQVMLSDRWRQRLWLTLILVLALPAGSEEAAQTVPTPPLSGRQLMDAVYARHQKYPYVFEELSMLLEDRHGQRETRRLNRYSRLAADGSLQVLLQFSFPRDLQGVALLATLFPDGRSRRQVFLPALGPYLIDNSQSDSQMRSGAEENFLGTDFSIENLIGEDLNQFRYKRARDTRIDGTDYFVVDVYAGADDSNDPLPMRRHFIMKNPMFVTRTDHLDSTGRLVKQQTHYDLTPISGTTWRANMMLMDNRLQSHQTIIKIDRRVLSSDYVPETVFTADWIFANAPEQRPATPAPEAAETDASAMEAEA